MFKAFTEMKHNETGSIC